mgnify:CR=1 FL=1
MAKKPTITTIASGYYSRQALNNNFTALNNALDNTVSRDGSTPNTMTADLDLNGQDILNANDIHTANLTVGGIDINTYVFATDLAKMIPGWDAFSLSTISSDFDVISVAHDGRLHNISRAVGGPFVAGDGSEWEPSGGRATPGHWGGIDDPTGDNSAAVQSAFDWMRLGYDTTEGTFSRWVDLDNITWRCTSPVFCNNIRQPDASFGNGGLFMDISSGTGLECYGTNTPRIVEPFWMESPVERTACPDVLFAIGRCEDLNGVVAPIAPSWSAKIKLDGCAKKAMMVNAGSEVSRIHGIIQNRHPNKSAVCYAGFNHYSYADDWFGGLTSTNVSLPTAADGAFSNILHDFGSSEFKRGAFFNLTVTGVNLGGTNVVINVTPGNTKPINGDFIYITDIGGTVSLETFKGKIANYDSVAGTFDLQTEAGVAVPSAGKSAWTSGGTVWCATGHAVAFGGAKGVSIGPEAYLLTYGSPSIKIDTQYGGTSGYDLQFQQENQPANVIEFIVGADAKAVQGFNVTLLGASQVISAAPFLITSAGGTLRIDDLYLHVSQKTGTSTDGICTNGSLLKLNNARVVFPNAGEFLASSLSSFSGLTEVGSTGERRWYVDKSRYITQTSAGLVAIMSGAVADGATVIDIRSVLSDAVALSEVGSLRFVLGSIGMGGVLVRATDVTPGLESSKLELKVKTGGVDKIAAIAESPPGNNFTGLTLLRQSAGVVTTERVRLKPIDGSGDYVLYVK